MIARPARPVSGSRSRCSVARQETTFAAEAARMKAPWMNAQDHGCAAADSLEYTVCGTTEPSTPWCRTTKPTAMRNGSQSW